MSDLQVNQHLCLLKNWKVALERIYLTIGYHFRHANDEFTVVANSFRYSQVYSNKLFFVSIDFDEGSDVFQLVSRKYMQIYKNYNTQIVLL